MFILSIEDLSTITERRLHTQKIKYTKFNFLSNYEFNKRYRNKHSTFYDNHTFCKNYMLKWKNDYICISDIIICLTIKINYLHNLNDTNNTHCPHI